MTNIIKVSEFVLGVLNNFFMTDTKGYPIREILNLEPKKPYIIFGDDIRFPSWNYDGISYYERSVFVDFCFLNS